MLHSRFRPIVSPQCRRQNNGLFGLTTVFPAKHVTLEVYVSDDRKTWRLNIAFLFVCVFCVPEEDEESYSQSLANLESVLYVWRVGENTKIALSVYEERLVLFYFVLPRGNKNNTCLCKKKQTWCLIERMQHSPISLRWKRIKMADGIVHCK